MKNDLRLFIGGSEIELGSSPNILYTYTVDDLTNPTAVKNSFSKTITIDGTPNNNKVFGQYWNVERLVGGGGGSGVDYNASKKVDFVIYVNGEIYESGYVKMEKINCINNRYTYDISLFGGLGDFFYSLSYSENTGDKKRLSDLTYTEFGGEDEFDFTATATTITEAWDALKNGTDGKWQHINFMPAYNGLPDDFDSDKVIINLSGTSLPSSDPDNIFLPQSGCVIADLPEEMTEWEIRDLRSYNQRPCIKMSSIVSACCDPKQNGSYEVDLDPEFFNDDNPYWTDTWLSLPLMKNLEYANEEQTLEGANLIGVTTTGNTEGMMYQDLKFDIGDYGSSTPSSINVKASVFMNNPLNQLNAEIDPWLAILSQIQAPYLSYVRWWPLGDYYISGWWCVGSLFVQLIAMNGEVVVGASEAYNLTNPIRHKGKLYFGNNRHYSGKNKFVSYLDKPIYDVLGTFENDGFHREGQSSAATLDFTIRGCNSPISQLKMVFFFGASDNKIKHFNKTTFFESVTGDGASPGNLSFNDPFPLTVGIRSTNFKAVLGESLGRSGTKVTKSLLLNTDGSPADYLLSYCKMFGLYFRKEVDAKRIHIETRKTFYKRDEIVNLEDYIDRGKDIKVSPIVFKTKWYDMVQEQDDTQFYEKYVAARGIEYGSKLLNTGYEFDVQKKKLYEGSVIRSGIEGLERSKFFSAFNDDTRQRSWMGMGLHYTLFYGGEADYEVNVPIRNNNDLMGINENEGMKYYDVFPKMQFHADDNDPTDGNNVLVFFSGFKSVTSGRSNPLRYYVSDDNMYQTLLNDSTPCWFFTAQDSIGGTQFVYPVTELPVFERYLTDANSGKIKKSLDFGTPQELYIPDYNITEDVNIYSNYWRTYIEDLFDANTRILSCYVVANGKVNGDWLRRFYWFDNAIWRINKITDWNLADFGPTQFEFVKVQNIANYTVPSQGLSTVIGISASTYTVGPQGGTVTLYVTISSGGSWRITSSGGAVLSRTTGNGDIALTATIPANGDDESKGYYFTVSSDDNSQARCTIIQSYDGMTDFTPTPQHLVFPASGAGAYVDFIWNNQGGDYIDSVDFNEGSDYLVFTADTTSRQSEDRAILTVGVNSGETVLSNYCQFQSHNGINHAVTLDQLPESITFTDEGGSESISLSYSGANISGLPYWVTSSTSGNQITFTAIPNEYDSGRTGSVKIAFDGTPAEIAFNQSAGTGHYYTFKVEPNNLYFTQSGGTKMVNITCQGVWTIDSSSTVGATISQTQGDGNTIISVTMGENSGSQITTSFDVYNGIAGYVYDYVTVNIVQDGVGGSVSASVTPTATTVASSGGTADFNVYTTGMTNPVLSVTVDSQQISPNITWYGNRAYVQIDFSANTTSGSVTHQVGFFLDYDGRVYNAGTSTVTQARQSYYFNVSPTTVNFPASGGSTTLTPNSNTCWIIEPESTFGEIDAIGFESPSWNLNNLIDTGVHPTQTSTMRVSYEGRGVVSDRIMGTVEGYGGCNDGEDYRIFDIFQEHLVFDRGYDRQETWDVHYITEDETEYDITMGNGVVTNNLTSTNWFNTSAATIETAYTMCVDVGSVWVKEVVIEDNGVTLFSGTPYSSGGVVGLYDSVSNSVKTLYSGSSGTLIARESAGVLSISPLSGCGSTNITISVPLNTGVARQGGFSVYRNDNGTKAEHFVDITVKQLGQGTELSVFPTALTFDSDGGTATFTITSNTNWTIE